MIATGALVTTMLVALGLTTGTAPASADAFTPDVAVTNAATGKPFILAGEDASYEIAVSNPGGSGDKYNVSVTALLPVDIDFRSASFLGEPTVYTEGDILPNRTRDGGPTPATDCAPLDPVGAGSTACAVPAGQQLWVWQNIADLPEGGTIRSTLTVRPDATVYPVGTADLGFEVRGYTSNDVTLLPTFDGSTSVSPTSGHTSEPGVDQVETDVRSLRVVKSEPSPEQELLRGVHDNSTTYEIVVENTGQGATDSVVVVDYLHAGLEYLGAGGSDNTETSATLYDGDREYPGAPSIATPAPAGGTGDWDGTGETVETVELDASAASALGLPGAGVYTKVTWTLGTRSGGTAQATDLSAPATADRYTIRYRAAVPLFENTMDWENPSGTAPAITGEQARNLNNNNGPSTRHGLDPAAHDDAQAMQNTVTATGAYQGQVTDPATDRDVEDSDAVTISAVDLRVIKSVTPTLLDVGELATYTLELATSEYMSADSIVLHDEMANGLCPAFPAGSAGGPGVDPTFMLNGVVVTDTDWDAAVGPECAQPSTFPGAAVTNAVVDHIDFITATGGFRIGLVPTDMTEGATLDVTYTAFQRTEYYPANRDGVPSSGDSLANTVALEGTTEAIPALATVESSSGAVAYGTETVWDDSDASLTSDLSALTKQVLARGIDPSSATPGDWYDVAPKPFALGDAVYYKVRIRGAENIETRDAVLIDHLPVGVDYVSSAPILAESDLPGVDPADVADYLPSAPEENGNVLTWRLGAQDTPPSTSRFLPRSSVVVYLIEGVVVGQSESALVVDSPQNHAKYQQRNTEGEIFFLRDTAAIDLDWGVDLVKGIRTNTNPAGPTNAAFGSDVDGRLVVQGDKVTYRIDVTLPESPVRDLVIWDALPVGITKADVVGGSMTVATAERVGTGAWSESPLTSGADFTAVAVDWADMSAADRDAVADQFNDRSFIKWVVSAELLGTDTATDTVRGATLGYTIEVPGTGATAAQITQTYENTAGIVSYGLVNNGGGTTTLVPEGPTAISDTGAQPGQTAVTDENSSDPSDVYLPDPDPGKVQTTSQITLSGGTVTDARNPVNGFVEGETVTYEVSVTLPARTTVAGGELKDDGRLTWTGSPNVTSLLGNRTVGYDLVASSLVTPGTLPSGFAFDAGTGTLTFPPTYTTGATDEEFTIELEVRPLVKGLNLTLAQRDQLHGKSLTNTGRFTYTSPSTGNPVSATDTATVQYLDPKPTLGKSASTSTVGTDGTVQFTLTPGNTPNRPTLYDVTVLDCVPAGIAVSALTPSTGSSAAAVVDSCRIESGAIVTGSGGTNTGTLITWTFDRLDRTPAPQLVYTGTVSSGAGGGASFTNYAELSGYTLPATIDPGHTNGALRDAGSDETITLSEAGLTKSVDPSSAPVGATVKYTLVTTLPANANFYDVELVDTLPAGVAYAGNPDIVFGGDWAGSGGDPAMSAAPAVSPDGRTLTWTVDAPGDIPTHTAERTITITFDALITNAVVASAPLNSSVFNWFTVDGGGPADELSTPPATADVTILDPALQIVKKVDGVDAATYEPDEGFTYTLEVSQTAAGATPAHNITVQDVVPAGVVVDTAQPKLAGATFSDADDLQNGRGGTIMWQLAGPIDIQGGTGTTSITLTYDASFIDSTGLTATALDNTADVTSFESFGTGGRVYPQTPGTIRDTASVTPRFPDVVPTKSVTTPVAGETYGVAEAGESFGWTLTITNQGDGTAQAISVTDVLPKNWAYDAGSAKIAIGGDPAVALPDPVATPASVSAGDTQTLVWDEMAISNASAAPLDAGDAFVITFTATPTTDALTDAGTDIGVNPHTNTLSVTATDTDDNDHNATGDYVGPQSTADAYIARANLLLEKTGIGGVTDPSAFGGLAAGTWLAGQGVATGYAQPQWRIVVTNQGPDDGVGPFEVVDTMPALPTGVTLGDWSARYYSSASDTVGTDLGTFPAGSGTMTVGTDATSLQADRSDRIVLTANVTIGADAVAAAPPAGLTLENKARVTGGTYEDPDDLDDNEDNATKDVAELADLTITKTVIDPASPAAPVVGEDITWQIAVSNLGPSVSRSVGPDDLITITDTVPAGMTGVTATDSADWVATLADGSPIPAAGADAGDVITWTYQGAAMPVGATVAVTLTGTILTSHTGTLTNTAVVVPGDTPDPVTPNNTSNVPSTPDDSTRVSITKTRVVPDGAGWRQADPLTDPDDAFVAGDPVHYLIEVTNAGPADARDVTVVDEAPEGLTYASHANVEGTWTRAPGGSTSAHPGGAPTGRAFDTFTLTGTQPKTDAPTVPATAFVVTYDTESTLTGAVVNWAEVTIGNWDPTDPGDHFDRDDDSTGSTRIVDLGIAKSHAGTGPFVPGTEVEYTLVVTNHGPSATSGALVVTDELAAGMAYSGATPPTITVPTGTTAPVSTAPALSGTDDRILTWSLLDPADTFDVGETITITYRVLTDPLVRGGVDLDNTAEVDGPDREPVPDPNPNEDDDTITTAPPEAAMTIAKTVAAGPWLAGTNVSYTLTITNAGPSAAVASVTDTLPTGLTMVSMSGTNWDCGAVVAGAASGTCDYLDATDTDVTTQVLHPVGTSTITVVAHIAPTVLTGTTLTNEAELTWTDGVGTYTDDDDAPITVTTDADLGIVKDVITGAGGTVVPDPAPATAGETAWYRLQVTNHGPSDAVGPITVVDELPLGVTVPTTLTSVGPWTVVADPVVPATRQTVTLTLATGLLANTPADTTRGVAPVIEFEVDLDPTIAAGTTLTNDAAVSSPTPDSDTTNNDDDADLLVERLVDLGIAKTHPVDANGQVVIDQPLDFTIQVTNHGPSEASGITVTDTIPVGLEVTSATGPITGTGWTIDSITLVDPLDVAGGAVIVASYTGALGITAPGNAADPLVIETIVRESAVGTTPNHAAVTANEPEPSPDPNPNDVDDPLDVLPRVTLVVTKTAIGAFQVGKRGTYEITVENLGPHDDPGPLEVEDVLPAGLTYYASPHPGVSVAGQTVTWVIPSLAMGDTETITLVVDVHQAAYPSVRNVAVVTTPSELTPLSDPEDDDTVTVAEADPIPMTGLDSPLAAVAVGVLLLLGGAAFVAASRRQARRID